MNLRTVLILNAIVAGLFGVGFLIKPEFVLSLYGMTADTTGLLLARFLGAATVGFAAVTWLLRSAGDPDARRGLVLALFIGWGAGLVVSFIGLGASPLGWVNVVMYGFFTVAYAYFQFTTPGAAMPKPMTSSTLSAPPAASPAPARPAASRAPARRTPARRRK